eukprot:gene12584-8623_t
MDEGSRDEPYHLPKRTVVDHCEAMHRQPFSSPYRSLSFSVFRK